MEDTTTREGLVRGIRKWDMLALVLNSVIGSGIFGLPGQVFAAAGVYSLVAYAVCAFLVVLFILCFSEVSSRFNVTGGPYLYAKEAFGPLVGFEIGWLSWLARLTSYAALANLWLTSLGFFIPGVTEGAPRYVLITALLAVYTIVNYRGVKDSTLFNDTFTVAKLGPLLMFVLVGIFFIDPSALSFGAAPSRADFTNAIFLLVFAFSGFEMATIPAGESKDPKKHAPFALIGGIAFVVVLYILIQIVSIGTLPGLAESTRPLADAATGFMGRPGGIILAAGALISITGTLNVIMLVGPRLPFAMAEAGQLPRAFAATHPRFKTPHISILVSAAVMWVLTIQGSFVSQLTISTVIRLVAYAATCAALPMLRKKSKEPAGFVTFAGPAVAILAIALSAYLIYTRPAADQLKTLYAAVLGLVLYFVFKFTVKPVEARAVAKLN
jgi:basic amino acid/polyamine antiporter, APA family